MAEFLTSNGTISPISPRKPDDWLEKVKSPEWASAKPEARLLLLADHTKHAREYELALGRSQEEVDAHSKEFFNTWRGHAIDNGIAPGEHIDNRILTKLSDGVFGAVAGAGIAMNIDDETAAMRASARAKEARAKLTPEFLARLQKQYFALPDEKNRQLFRDSWRDKYDIEITEDDGEIWADYADPEDPGNYGSITFALGQGMRILGGEAKEQSRSTIEKFFSENPALTETFLLGDLPEAVGSALGYLGAGAATGGVGVVGMGIGGQAESAYFTAKAAGASPDQIEAQVYTQGAIGALEGLGLGGLKWIDKTPFGKTVKQGVARYLFGGMKEGSQEVIAGALVDVSEKYGGIDPERNILDGAKIARTFGASFIVGSALTGLERSEQEALIKGQVALNKIAKGESASVLDGSHPVVQQLQSVIDGNASDEVRAAAMEKLGQFRANAREMMDSVIQNESQLEEAASVYDIIEADERSRIEKLLGPEQIVALRDADEEAFAASWKGLDKADKTELRSALGVSPKAKIADVRAAFAKQTADVAVEPDLATATTADLVQFWETLDTQRGEAPSKIAIVQTEADLQAEIDRVGVTPEAMDAAQSVADSLTISDESVTADPDIVRPSESEFGESFEVLGANWAEYQDGVRQSAISVVAGEKAPLILAREKSQAWFKTALSKGDLSMDELRAERASYEQFDPEAASKAPDTDEGMIEWASDLAVDYLTGKATQTKTLPERVRNFFAALGRWFDNIMRRSVRLQKALDAGAISPRFENQLAQATGVQRGAEFNPTEGLTDAETVQFSSIRGKSETEVDAYLAQNPDVSDSVLTAYQEDLRRSKASRELAGRITVPGIADKATLSVSRKMPAFRMTREGLRESIARINEIIRDLPLFRPAKRIKVTLREAQDLALGGRMGEAMARRNRLESWQRDAVVKAYRREIGRVRQARKDQGEAGQRVERKRIESESLAVEKLAVEEFTNSPVVSAVLALGGLKSKKVAAKKENFRLNAGDYDGAPNLSKRETSAIYNDVDGESIDVLATSIAEQGLIPDGNPQSLWDAIDKASNDSKRQAARRYQEETKSEFMNALGGGRQLIYSNDLAVGDELQIGGQAMTVTDVSEDGIITVRGEKFGIQSIDPDQPLYVDRVISSALAPQTMDENQAAPPEDLLSVAEGRKVIELDVNAEMRETFKSRMAILNTVRDLEGILAALPSELRGIIGGFGTIAASGPRVRRKVLLEKARKAQGVLERHAQRTLIEQAHRIMDLGEARLNAKGSPEGPAGAEVGARIGRIREIAKLSPDEAAARMQVLDGLIAEEEDAGRITELSEEILDVAQFSDLENRDATTLFGVVDYLRELVDTGRSQRRALVEMQRKENEDDRRQAIDVMTGGNGLMNSADASREADKLGSFLEQLDQFNRAHLSWEWLLNATSRLDQTSGPLRSWVNKKFGRLVREAENGEQAFIRRKNNAMLLKMAEARGIDTTKRGWKFRLTLATVDHYQKQNKTRVMRREISDDRREVRDVPIALASELQRGRIPTDESGRKLGKNPNQQRIILEALQGYQEEVAAVAQSLEAEQAELARLTGTVTEPEVLAASKKRVKALESKLRGLKSRTKLKGVELTDWDSVPEVEQRLSQDQAIKITLVARQEDQQAGLLHWGWTPEVVEQVEAFLTPESRELRDWLADEYNSGYDEINSVYKKEYGANLPKILNYSPAPKITNKSMADIKLSGDVGAAGNLSPGFLTTRVKNRAEPNFETGAVSEYQRHVAMTAHFINWVAPMRKLRSVFGHKDAQKAITQAGGRALNAEIQARLRIFADGGVRNAQSLAWIDTIRRALVLKGLSFNLGQFPKQLTGIPAYMFEVPVRKFLKYQGELAAEFATAVATGEASEDLRAVIESDFIKDRWNNGYDRDVRAILSGAFDKRAGGEMKPKSLLSHIIESGMMPSRAGDLSTAVVGGYAAYRHGKEMYIREARQRGENVDSPAVQTAARNEGLIYMAEVTERTQTGSGLKDLSSFESGGSASRLFTVFLTNARNYYQSTYMTLPDAIANRPGARKDFARRWIVGHIVLPTLFQLVVDALKVPFQGDEEREEYLEPVEASKRYGYIMALGPLAGLYGVGQGIAFALQKLFDQKSFTSPNPVAAAVAESGDGLAMLADGLEDGISLEDVTKTTLEILEAHAALTGGGTLVIPIAERGLKSLGLDDDLDQALFESPTEKAARVADERWDGMKRDLAKLDDKARKDRVAEMRKAGDITSAEAKLLARTKKEREESPEIKKLRGFGVSSGARAAAMREQLRGLPEAARQDLMDEWEAADLLSPTVTAQLSR